MAGTAHEYTRQEQLARSNAIRLIQDAAAFTREPIEFLDVLEDTLYSPQELARTFKSLEESGDIYRCKKDGRYVGWYPLIY